MIQTIQTVRNPAVRDARKVRDADYQILWLKRWIWLYFWLLIFEGALRKWIIPSLSGPLLIIRDPVAVMIYFQAYKCGRFTLKTMWPFAFMTLAILPLTVAQVIMGVNTPAIALYGLRSYLLHLPLTVVMAETLNGEDIRRIGRWILMLSVPMTALLVAQFYAPSVSWLNAGAGEGSGQIGSALGHVRPAGTFSYGIGAQAYVGLVIVFVLYASTRRGMYPKWLTWISAFASIAVIPALGSRSFLFTTVIVAGFCLIAGTSSTDRLFGFVKVFVLFVLFAALASQLSFFEEASVVMSTRWQQASRTEGDIENILSTRVFNNFRDAFESAGAAPLLGNGVGMGSNFAAVIKTGSKSFLMAEGEWERVVLEFGPLFGLAFMILRVGIAYYIFLQATRALKRKDMLAWLLLPTVLPAIIVNAMEQPTYLGFMVFGAGLCLAAVQVSKTSRAHAVYA
jgi:hypothetical protein